jgi:hypothetical protein
MGKTFEESYMEIKAMEERIKNTNLPEYCFTTDETDQEVVIVVRRFLSGYNPVFGGDLRGQELADRMNRALGVSKQQEIAMKCGSMFGWHVPGADPNHYDEAGHFVWRDEA